VVSDTRRLRAQVFERSGIAIDEQDPIMAVLAVCAQQTEDIGKRLLSRTNPVRVAIVMAATAAIFAGAGAVAGWILAGEQFKAEQSEWLRQNAYRCQVKQRGAEVRNQFPAWKRRDVPMRGETGDVTGEAE
jgi:hypothetical protein